MFKAAFKIGERKLQADFWIIPDPSTLERLNCSGDEGIMSDPISSVGLGEMRFSRDPNDVLIAFGLGSCLGIGMYDPVAKVGGIISCRFT